ncbi:MAG: TetR family transcriptional regulator [Caulobacter sp.]|nr:TetR family transcriptional regulator [Caulobacter sp.]
MLDPEPPSRPSAEARRRQIQDAAAICFRRSGFHGATMAEIARAANLSVGQIYRYFDNKEAIIEAIVEQDLAERRIRFAEFPGVPGNVAEHMIETCVDAIDRFCNPERAALMLEVLAEAARNPKVAAILQKRDAEERVLNAEFRQRIRRPEWTEEETEIRAELMGMLFEGMAVRSINNPDIDPEKVAPVLKVVMSAIFGVSRHGPARDSQSA